MSGVWVCVYYACWARFIAFCMENGYNFDDSSAYWLLHTPLQMCIRILGVFASTHSHIHKWHHLQKILWNWRYAHTNPLAYKHRHRRKKIMCRLSETARAERARQRVKESKRIGIWRCGQCSAMISALLGTTNDRLMSSHWRVQCTLCFFQNYFFHRNH